jgi:hypothetical protein
MTSRKRVRSCSYAVAVDGDASAQEVAALASYLSTLGGANCEVLILDDSPAAQFDSNGRVLRWVGRHLPVDARYRMADGSVDLLRAAVEMASAEKIIVASAETRCSVEDVISILSLLDQFEVIEPDDYVAATNWNGGIEAGRILLHRGLEQSGQVRSTMAIRRSAYRPLLEFEERSGDANLRRLFVHGADAYGAHDVFVRREPPQASRWLKRRVREAAADFALPLKTALFLGVLPVLVMIALIGGATTAGGYAGIISFASMLLALKGRAGAASVFPLRACFFAPLWVAERSVMVYCALFDRMRMPRSVATESALGAGASKIAGTR